MKVLIIFISIIFFSLSFAAEKTIKLATLVWEPYIGPDLLKQGPVAEVIRQALQKEGYKLELIFMPWARALVEAEKATDGIDGCMPKYFDNSITEKFEFSEPFFESPVGLIIDIKNKRKIDYDHNKIDLNKTYDKLKHLNFGVVRGYFNEEHFDKRSDLSKIDVTTDELNVKNLVSKKVDVIFIDKFVFNSILRKNYKLNVNPEDYKMLHPPISSHKLYIIFSKKAKDYKEKIRVFNIGLSKLRKENNLLKIKQSFEDFQN